MKISVLSGKIIQPKQAKENEEALEEVILSQVATYKDKELFKNSKNYIFFRGTEFQVALQNSGLALELALKIRLATKAKFGSDFVKIAIGYGKLDNNSLKINQARGSAFEHSGQGLDAIENKSFIFQSNDKQLTKEINMFFVLLEPLVKKLSKNMSEAMLLNMLGLPQTEIAWHLNLTQSAISKRLKSANSEVILQMLDYYRDRFK